MLNVVVDLSHYNSVTDLGAAKASGILGVIHKATQGLTYLDPTYASHRQMASHAGLWWGAYHFGIAGDGVAQAEYFLEQTQPDAETLLVLDLENNPTGGSMTLQEAHEFVTHIQQATGRYPGLYGGSMVKQLLGNSPDPVLSQCWFWLAQYGPTPVVPSCWKTWTMWQYTDGAAGNPPHSVPGIGLCDRDTFNGSLTGLQELWGVPQN